MITDIKAKLYMIMIYTEVLITDMKGKLYNTVLKNDISKKYLLVFIIILMK